MVIFRVNVHRMNMFVYENFIERDYERYRKLDCYMHIRSDLKEDVTLSMVNTAMHNSIRFSDCKYFGKPLVLM